MRSRSIATWSLTLVLLLLVACSAATQSQGGAPGPGKSAPPPPENSSGQMAGPSGVNMPPALQLPVYTFEVHKSYPHDPGAFTQGLVLQDGALFESTGLYGSSSLRQVDLKTGRVLKKISVPREYFAEGMTLFRDKIFQLTWQAHKGFTYDPVSFEKLGEFAYEGEGWGLTHDDQFLIMSDGTNRIRFLDPSSFRVVRSIEVHDGPRPLLELNELEYVKGSILANVWQTDRIARIDPRTGQVTGWIDLTGLLQLKDSSQPIDVLNGIAYDEAHDRLFVTGKLWPRLFEIKLKTK